MVESKSKGAGLEWEWLGCWGLRGVATSLALGAVVAVVVAWVVGVVSPPLEPEVSPHKDP